MNTNNDVSINPTSLYYGSKAITSAKESVNDLSAGIKNTNITDDELTTIELLPKAKSTIEKARNKAAQLEEDIAKTIDKIKEMDPIVAYVFDYLDEQDIDIDTLFEEAHKETKSVAETQKELFDQVDYYDEIIPKEEEELKAIRKRIDYLTEEWNMTAMSRTDGASSARNSINPAKPYISTYDDGGVSTEDIMRSDNKRYEEIQALIEKYSQLSYDISTHRYFRDMMYEKANSMYLKYDDADEKSQCSIVRLGQISETKEVFDGAGGSHYETQYYTVGYDKDGNVINSHKQLAIYHRMHPEDTSFDISDISEEYFEESLQYLSDEEIQVANYLYNSGKTEELEEYLAYMEDKANQRHGRQMAKEVTDHIDLLYRTYGKVGGYAATTAYLVEIGLWDGIGNFFDGLENFLYADGKNSAEDYKKMLILQDIQERYGDNRIFEMIAEGGYEISSSLGNMAPSMLVGMIPGFQFVGLSLMGISAAGNARENALKMGMSEDSAWLYGVLNGLSEAGLEYLLGGIPGLSNFKKFEELSGFKGFFAKMLSEATEESLQSILDPMFLTLTSGGEIPFEVDWDEVIKSGIYAMITAGIMNGVHGGINIVIDGIKYEIAVDKVSTITEEFNGKDLTKPEVKASLIANINGDESSTVFSTDTEIEIEDTNVSNITVETSVDFGDIFNGKMNCGGDAVTVITDTAVITRYNSSARYGNHTGNFANIISDILGEQVLPSDFILKKRNTGDYGAFIRYVDFGDFTQITIELPNEITTGCIDGLEELGIQWRNVELEDGKAALWFCTDEEFNKSYDPEDDGISIYDLDKLIDYLREKNQDNRANQMPKILNGEGSSSKTQSKEVKIETSVDFNNQDLTNPTFITSLSLFNRLGSIIKGNTNVELINTFFSNLDGDFGADQGFLTKQAYSFVNHMSSLGSAEFRRLKGKLIGQGFPSHSAEMVIKGLDSEGACTYAAISNGIFITYINNPNAFEKTFGYPMYTINDKGGTILNTGELLLDMYTYINNEANGGRLFRTNPYGLTTIISSIKTPASNMTIMRMDASHQQYLSWNGLQSSIIESFLKSKDPDLRFYDDSIILAQKGQKITTTKEMKKMAHTITKRLANNHNVQIDIWDGSSKPIVMHSMTPGTPSTSTVDFKGGGHAMAVVGVTNDGFIVSSWGNEYLIKYSDLINNEFNIYSWYIYNVSGGKK